MKQIHLVLALMLACGLARAQSPAGSFVAGTPEDEAAIRAIMASAAASKSDIHFAADLDWENAFGIRYFDVKRRDDFYGKIAPQFKDAVNETIEVKIRFIEPTVAVSDEYWHVAGQVYAGETKPGADRWGRTTYVFKKVDGTWSEVLERVADLRSAYFKHFVAMPAAVPVPAATLATYAGTYTLGRGTSTVTVEGDHLMMKSAKGTYTLVPTTPAEFLSFTPGDLAVYYKVTFTKDAGGKLVLNLMYPTGEAIASAARTP